MRFRSSEAASATELLGGIEGVARAKGELIDCRVRATATRTTARILTYGAGVDADVDPGRLDHVPGPASPCAHRGAPPTSSWR
jgi:hypothetical protein